MYNEIVNLGSFEVVNNKLMVTDPCYERGTWCHGILENVANGKWYAYATITDRVRELEIRHEHASSTLKAMEEADFEVGVDSGQAGFFREDMYPAADTGRYNDLTTLYGRACATTISNHIGGTIVEGAVTVSGYGDGGYVCLVGRDEEGIVRTAKIIFIDEADDEEDYEVHPPASA